MSEKTDKIIKALEDADRVSKAAVSMYERVRGIFGGSSPLIGKPRTARWQRWRSHRCRLRATQIEAGSRRRKMTPVDRAKLVEHLRGEAAVHLALAFDREQGRGSFDRLPADHPDRRDYLALVHGREPRAE